MAVYLRQLLIKKLTFTNYAKIRACLTISRLQHLNAHENHQDCVNQNENIHVEENKMPMDSEELKTQILEAALTFVPHHGWSKYSLAAGAESLGLASVAHGMFPDAAAELIDHFHFSSNRKLEGSLQEFLEDTKNKFPKEDVLQEFLEGALENKLRMILPYITKWPEAMALMLLPQHIPSDFRNVMDLVDTLWFYSGDKSVNMKWYTKRASLAAVYKASELCLVQDSSQDYVNTWEFLHRQLKLSIEGGDYIEKLLKGGDTTFEACGGALITAISTFQKRYSLVERNKSGGLVCDAETKKTFSIKFLNNSVHI